MDKMNNFMEIFGLNVKTGDVIKDKGGNEFKVYYEYRKVPFDEESIKDSIEEKEETLFKGKDILEIDGVKYVTLDAVYKLEEYHEFDGVKYVPLEDITDPAGFGVGIDSDDEHDKEYEETLYMSDISNINEIGEMQFEDDEHHILIHFQMVSKRGCQHR